MRLIPFSRGFYLALPLGVVLPLMMLMASVGPGDAASNISKWADLFGLKDTAIWLANPLTDHIVLYTTIPLFCVYLIWLAVQLKKHCGPNPALKLTATQMFNNMNNSDLRLAAEHLAKDIRAYASGSLIEMNNYYRNASSKNDWNPEAADHDGHELILKIGKRYEEELKPKALALREIMLLRIGRIHPFTREYHTFALDGDTSHPYMVVKVSDLLERIARSLP